MAVKFSLSPTRETLLGEFSAEIQVLLSTTAGFFKMNFPFARVLLTKHQLGAIPFSHLPLVQLPTRVGGHRELGDRVPGTSRVVFIPRWQQLPKSCTWSKAAGKNAGQDERDGHNPCMNRACPLGCSRSENRAKILGGQHQEPYRWLRSLPDAGWDGGKGLLGWSPPGEFPNPPGCPSPQVWQQH